MWNSSNNMKPKAKPKKKTPEVKQNFSQKLTWIKNQYDWTKQQPPSLINQTWMRWAMTRLAELDMAKRL